jgi:DNA-binding GntR family transcriptional regulator
MSAGARRVGDRLLKNGVITPVVTQTKADATYTELRKLILEGQFQGNTVLNQEQLAGMLGVSTTPLREALRRLEAESLVETRAKGQVIVTEVDPARLPHIYRVREELDCLAARLAASAATPEDIKRMRAASQVKLPKSASHLDAWAANAAFHRTIHAAAHNPVLIEAQERIYQQYDRYNATFTQYVLDETARAEHAAMVAAIESGDPDEAAALMRAHYDHGRRFIPELYADAPA